MPLPKGDVHKKKEVIQDVTLHDLDVANARPQVAIANIYKRLNVATHADEAMHAVIMKIEMSRNYFR